MAKHKLLITIDDELKEKLKEIAKKENRTLSNLIETVLIQIVKDLEKKNVNESLF